MMNALYLDQKLTLDSQYPMPVPEEGWALVQVLLAGICGTDLALVRGYHDFKGVIGHEFVGRVLEADDETLVGQRVVGSINVGCGKCHQCLTGLEMHCPDRRALGIRGIDGAFAEYMTLPEKNLHPVADSISDVEAVFAEPMAAALHVKDAVHFHTGYHVAVMGAGKLGMLVAQVLRGYHPLIIETSQERVDLATSWGLHAATSAADFSFDIVVDCTGSEDGLRTAMSLVRPTGTIVAKSTFEGVVDFDLAQLVVNEITLVGSRCGSFPHALDALMLGGFHLEDMVEGIYPLSEAMAAFEHASRPGALKVLLKP